MEDNRNYQRIAVGLQQRIAEITSMYEGTIALTKEDHAMEVEAFGLRIKELEEDVAEAKKASKKASTDKAN